MSSPIPAEGKRKGQTGKVLLSLLEEGIEEGDID